MAYAIEWTPDAKLDLRWFDKGPQVALVEATARFLKDQPALRTRRKRPMEPNTLGVPWALRLDEVEARVYYDIDEPVGIVRVLRVGRKIRQRVFQRVFIRGVETDMREGA